MEGDEPAFPKQSRYIYVMLHLVTFLHPGKVWQFKKMLDMVLLHHDLFLLSGAEEHPCSFHRWSQPKTCTSLPPEDPPTSQPPARTSYLEQIGPKDQRQKEKEYVASGTMKYCSEMELFGHTALGWGGGQTEVFLSKEAVFHFLVLLFSETGVYESF